MTYNHTQYGRWHYVLFAFTMATLGGTWLVRSEPPLAVILMVIAAIFALCGLLIGSLTTSDEGEYLALSFGPLPLLRKRIRYADITGVEVSRTSIIDGWGMHYIPGRGWTYNIWGFACVKLTLGGKIIRVGSDDAEGLAKFLDEKIGVRTKHLREPTRRASYQAYKPVNDAAARNFVNEALIYATELFGEPLMPIREIHLRSCDPIDAHAPRVFWSCVRLEDAATGVFTIFLVPEPSNPSFFGTLAHEVAHLLNPLLLDCYVEGLASVFAEQVLTKMGMEADWAAVHEGLEERAAWVGLHERQVQERGWVHATTYRMMAEMWRAMNASVRTLLKYAVRSAESGAMEIDIDRWISSLDNIAASLATGIIGSHAPHVEKARRLKFDYLAFRIPRGVTNVIQTGEWYAEWISKLKR